MGCAAPCVCHDSAGASVMELDPMCQDPLLSCLERFGYSIVRFPGPQLRPLQLLARFGRDLESLGPLELVLVPGKNVSTPGVLADQPCPALSGQGTSKFDASLGLSLLSTIVSSLGGSPQVVNVIAERAHKVAFEFGEVTEDGVRLAELDLYLTGAKVSNLARHVARLLERDEVYVTTSVVKSRIFSVNVVDDDDVGVELDLPSLRALAGAVISINSHGGQNSKISFEGPCPLAFGFRAVRLFYERGRYLAFKPLAAGRIALARETPERKWYRSEGPFASIRAAAAPDVSVRPARDRRRQAPSDRD